jgi:hypothetical protein
VEDRHTGERLKVSSKRGEKRVELERIQKQGGIDSVDDRREPKHTTEVRTLLKYTCLVRVT